MILKSKSWGRLLSGFVLVCWFVQLFCINLFCSLYLCLTMAMVMTAAMQPGGEGEGVIFIFRGVIFIH